MMKDDYLQRMLGEHEQVILMTRQHVFVLVRAIIFEIFAALIIIAAISLALALWVPNSPLFLGYILVLIPVVSLARDALIWKNHIYVVTNRRVVQVSGVINKNVIDSSLEKVNDVKMVQSFFGRLFDYGDVEILTGSELGVNLFRRIGNPVHFKTAMLNAKEHLERDTANPSLDENRPADIPALITQLDKMRQDGILTEAEFQIKKKELLAKL